MKLVWESNHPGRMRKLERKEKNSHYARQSVPVRNFSLWGNGTEGGRSREYSEKEQGPSRHRWINHMGTAGKRNEGEIGTIEAILASGESNRQYVGKHRDPLSDEGGGNAIE